MNYSTEQAANIAIAIGFILKLFKIEIASEELTNFVAAAMVLGGIGWNWYKRYQHGKDGSLPPVTLGGFRKKKIG